MTKRQLIRYIRSLSLHIFTACILAAIGICCFLVSGTLSDSYYDQWSNTKQTDAKLRRAEIVRAIDLQPERMEAYRNLLSEYLTDDSISQMEHEHLQNVLNAHNKDLAHNGAEAAGYFRILGFEYLACYEKSTQERLKVAVNYFDTAAPTPSEDAAQALAISVYTDIFHYYNEYVWTVGYIRQPSREQISELLHHISAAMATMQKASQEDRLAFYVCVADLITQQEDLWAQKYDADAVEAIKEKVLLQTQTTASTPAANKLMQELEQWKHLHYPQEEEAL